MNLKEVNHVEIQREFAPGNTDSMCKGPEVRVPLALPGIAKKLVWLVWSNEKEEGVRERFEEVTRASVYRTL